MLFTWLVSAGEYILTKLLIFSRPKWMSCPICSPDKYGDRLETGLGQLFRNLSPLYHEMPLILGYSYRRYQTGIELEIVAFGAVAEDGAVIRHM